MSVMSTFAWAEYVYCFGACFTVLSILMNYVSPWLVSCIFVSRRRDSTPGAIIVDDC